jgi:hypothetical protein
MQDAPGRNAMLDDKKRRERLLDAVSVGLSIRDQAALAGVSADTLRRSLCCIDTPREGRLTTTDACQLCGSYVRARAEGAMQVLQECRPEFRASASFGYKKTEAQELTEKDSDDRTVTFDVVTVTPEDLDE